MNSQQRGHGRAFTNPQVKDRITAIALLPFVLLAFLISIFFDDHESGS